MARQIGRGKAGLVAGQWRQIEARRRLVDQRRGQYVGIDLQAVIEPRRQAEKDQRRQRIEPSAPPNYSLSAPLWSIGGGGEGRGEVGDSRALANAHLTLPSLRGGPLPLPPEGRRGVLRRRPAT